MSSHIAYYNFTLWELYPNYYTFLLYLLSHVSIQLHHTIRNRNMFHNN